MNQLDQISDAIRSEMDDINSARDQAIRRSRPLIRICAQAIRATHREEWDKAETLMAEARSAAETLIDGVKDYPHLYHAGYTQDALKEYVEAYHTYALIRDEALLLPQELGVMGNTWLNGLAEAATELRRRILDIIRHGYNPEAERLLDKMDEIYSQLVTFDYSDSITGGLRRRTDVVRGVLERTRGDVTRNLRQNQLEAALSALETKLGSEHD